MSVPTPCAGTVVKLHVRSPGAVVHEGDLLAELVCSGERLEAELMLPERGLALVRLGQPVKLLYDAFPYERYGVQYGTLRWLSPSSTAEPGGPAFRALADLESETVGVQGLRRPVLPGMTGRAAVIVGRRSLASYAIEPLRQIRESLAAGPPADAAEPIDVTEWRARDAHAYDDTDATLDDFCSERRRRCRPASSARGWPRKPICRS